MSNVPVAASNAKQRRVWRSRAVARCLGVGGTARKLFVRPRHSALVVVGPCPVEERCAGERPVSFGTIS